MIITDTLIKNGKIVAPTGSYRSDVLIRNGKIESIGIGLQAEDVRVIDAAGKLLFPGFIDGHTHFDLDNGVMRTADDFYTGTRAAIVGGTTTILDFATQNKGETLSQGLENWHERAHGKSSCDYGFHMAITEWNKQISEEINTMIEAGVTSFKLYMAYDNLKVNDGQIYEVLKRMKETGCIVGVHCENGDLVNERIKEQKELGNMTPKAHPVSRPDVVESEAIHRYLDIASLVDVPVHIVHLSTKLGYEEAKRARDRGQKVYIETCPQYLLLDDSVYNKEGLESFKYVLSPPLRKAEDIQCLWEALKNNEIDTIATDHCSFNLIGQKDYGIHDFSKIPNGIPGVEHRPALLYSFGVGKGRITKEQMCRVLCENPAKLFGMYPQKGSIQVGSDGDIVIWDESQEWIITKEEQEQNVDYTPYEGIHLVGKATQVFLRGQLVVTDGHICEEKAGEYVYRRPHSRT